MRIYFARPISGCTPQEVQLYYKMILSHPDLIQYEKFIPFVENEIIRTDEPFRASGYDGLASDHAIYERDKWFAEHCDILLVNLLGSKSKSIGCMFELVWAKKANAHTLVIMEPNNPHYHAFVLQAADMVFATFEDAISYLKTFKKY